ncbi:MAG TPA: hypothetical protein VJ814_06855 [Gaiellaceae bacterium]|nr:hypothetical protein [Gaiellaceae bacterium]
MTDASLAAAERAAWRFRLPVVREAALCAGVATVAASLLVWLAPPGGDLAAHEYQRSLFLLHGFTLWDNFWYAGRYAFVGYSVLYYPLAALLGIALLAVLSVAVAAGGFARLLEREWGRAAVWPGRSFALLWPGVILAGELPLALGAALALLSLLALQSGRRWIGAALIVLVLAASPVAFVLLAVVLAGMALGRRPGLRARGAMVPAVVLVLAAAAEGLALHLFPTGTLGFPTGEAAQALLFCVYLFALTWRLDRARGLHGFMAVYLVVVVATYAIPSGLGHDVARMRLLAFPIALLVVSLRRWRPLPAVVLALGLAASWNLFPLASSWASSAADRTSRPEVWTAPVGYLRTHLQTGYRVEAVDTIDHWPALYLARARIPLVRGWFRQDDRPVASLLYRPSFTAAEYVAWLRRLGVSYVVLTNAPSDHSSLREASLIRSGRSGLRQVFLTPQVSIYAVPRPQSIVAGPGRPTVLALRESRVVVQVSRAGTYRLAVRWSPYWHASTGCLARRPDGMLGLRTRSAATVQIGFDVDARSLLDAFVGSPRENCAS